MEMRERRERLETRWGHQAARQWGEDERRIQIGGKVYADGFRVVDGWPSHSPAMQWKDGDGGSHKRSSQHFAEVWTTDDAWRTRVAYEHMPEPMRAIMWLVYVEGGGVPKRVRERAGISRDAFYNVLWCCLDMVEAFKRPEEQTAEISG